MRKTDAKTLARALDARLLGNPDAVCTSVITNSKEAGEGSLFAALRGERFDGHDFIPGVYESGAAVVISDRDTDVPPGRAMLVVEDTRAALGDLARWYKGTLRAKIIAVTGSVGKTSTKEFIHSVISQKYNTHKTFGNLNNDIGLPLSILSIEDDHEYAVIEMGMNHLGEIAYLTNIARPQIAVITNIGVSHIENLGSRENILKAKLEILEGLFEGGAVIACGDEPLLYQEKHKAFAPYKTIYYGTQNLSCDIFAKDILQADSGTQFKVTGLREFSADIPTSGIHNVKNALCAVSAGLHLGLDAEQIRLGLKKFKNAAMRQNIFDHNGIIIIDDTYNANPDSMRAGIEVLAGLSVLGRKIAVLGDMLELGSYSKAAHEQVGDTLLDSGIDILFCKGEQSRFTYERFLCKMGKAFLFSDDESLFKKLLSIVKPGDAVLVKGSRGMRMENILKLWKVGSY